jgi:hypothetical protein
MKRVPSPRPPLSHKALIGVAFGVASFLFSGIFFFDEDGLK